MSSRDFTFLTLRNISAYETNGSPVADNYVLTISSGKQNWTRNLNVSSITFNSIPSSSVSTLVSAPPYANFKQLYYNPTTGQLGYN